MRSVAWLTVSHVRGCALAPREELTLSALRDARGCVDLGVAAEVVGPGLVRVGDRVELLP